MRLIRRSFLAAYLLRASTGRDATLWCADAQPTGHRCQLSGHHPLAINGLAPQDRCETCVCGGTGAHPCDRHHRAQRVAQLPRGQVAQGAVGTILIVMPTPRLDLLARVVQRQEPVHVQALGANAASRIRKSVMPTLPSPCAYDGTRTNLIGSNSGIVTMTASIEPSSEITNDVS